LPFSSNLVEVPTSISCAADITCANLPSLEIPSFASTCLPITVDIVTYLNEVFDKIFAPHVPGATPILQTIRSVLIKKLIFDYATLELQTHPITDFDSLNEFVNLVFLRSGLLS